MPLPLFMVVAFGAACLLSLPIGPVQMGVWSESLAGHRGRAAALALGGATGDVGWALAAVFGMNPWSTSGRAGAAIFLVYAALLIGLGLRSFLKPRGDRSPAPKGPGNPSVRPDGNTKPARRRWAYFQGLMLVAFNPMGAASWAVVLALLTGWGAALPVGFPELAAYAVAVGAGAAVYPVFIANFGRRLTPRFTPQISQALGRCFGAGIFSFGVYFLYRAARILDWL